MRFIETTSDGISDLLVVDIDHDSAFIRAMWGHTQRRPTAVSETPQKDRTAPSLVGLRNQFLISGEQFIGLSGGLCAAKEVKRVPSFPTTRNRPRCPYVRRKYEEDRTTFQRNIQMVMHKPLRGAPPLTIASASPRYTICQQVTGFPKRPQQSRP